MADIDSHPESIEARRRALMATLDEERASSERARNLFNTLHAVMDAKAGVVMATRQLDRARQAAYDAGATQADVSDAEALIQRASVR